MIDFALDAERERGMRPARRDLPGLPPALPADHDDDDGGDPGRAAADDRLGRGLRAAPSAGHRDGRRPDPVAGAHAVHDAGDLSRLRSRCATARAGAHGPSPDHGAGAPRSRHWSERTRGMSEPVGTVHRPPGRHDAADARHRARGRARVPPAAGVAAAAGRLPDDLGAGVAPRRQSRDDGGDGRDAARAFAGAHRRRHRDDVVEHAGVDPRYAAVRLEPRHRRRGARRAGGDQRRALAAAHGPAKQSDLPQGQPGRCADHDPDAHLRDADAGPDVRRRVDDPRAEALAGRPESAR